jgi:hypothetical protein
MKHPKQSISDEGATLIRVVAAQADPESIADILPTLSTEVWRNGHNALAGTKVTASMVFQAGWRAASSLARECTEPEEFAEILKREKRGSVLFGLCDNSHFPADLAQELLKKGNFQHAVTYERLLLHSGLYTKQVQRFSDGLAASSRMTVEAMIVGMQTSAEFRAEVSRRLEGGDTDLMVLTYMTIDALTSMPWTRHPPKGESQQEMNTTTARLSQLIPATSATFGRKLVNYLLGAKTEVRFSTFTGAPVVDDDSLRYLQERTQGLRSTENYFVSTLAGSDERAVRVSNVLNARCHDAKKGAHQEICQRWSSDPPVVIELLFSSDRGTRKMVFNECERQAGGYPGFGEYHHVVDRHLRTGMLTGWEGIRLAAYAHVCALGGWVTGDPHIADEIVELVASTPGDIEEIFNYVKGRPATSVELQRVITESNWNAITTSVPLILCSVGHLFNENQVAILIGKYDDRDEFVDEMIALAGALEDASPELRTRALRMSDQVVSFWFAGCLWGRPTPEDASNLIDAVSTYANPRHLPNAEIICKAMVVGGLGTRPHATLWSLRDTPLTEEFLRRYEDAAGPENLADLISDCQVVGAIDWLNMRNRSPADVVALTTYWCNKMWMDGAEAKALLSASFNHAQVLETFARCGQPELAEAALAVSPETTLPAELGVIALRYSTAKVFNQWVTGCFASPELTAANLAAVLGPADPSDPVPKPSMHAGGSNNARRVLYASDELAARGFGAVVTSTDGVPRELLEYSLQNPFSESPVTANYASTEMAKLLSLAGPQLTQYLLETVATWEGSFDDLRALILAVRPA